MSEDWLAGLIAGALQRLRRRLAPEGSRRARLAYRLYAPLLRSMSDEARVARIAPNARLERLASRSLPPLPPKGRVLLLKLDHIGDFVLALPALQALRQGMPDAEITLVCGPWNRAMAERSGVADHVLEFAAMAASSASLHRPEPAAQAAAFAQLLAPLGQFHLAVDFRHEAETRPLLALVPAVVRAGFVAPGAAGAALHIALPNAERISRPLHAEVRLAMLAGTVLAALRPAPNPAACLVGPATPPHPGPYAVLVPGAGAPIRTWPEERLAEVAAGLLAEHGLGLVVLGGEAERPAAARLAAGLPPGALTDLTGRLPLAEAPAVLAGARLVVGMDTGITHLAARLGVPTVSVFSGVARREVWQPTGPRLAILAGRADCSPCYLARVEQCAHGRPCLQVITVAAVLDACREMLSGQGLAAAAKHSRG